ncbi:hypothetical protein PFUGPA_05987 [Plasmodium falciparum Palo Alto/Uganda]|uniref:Rifin n=1 Tax=Plasmodium falciparum (isolate Palo Alto / Uganda) TaxID=57270 RepID=W4IRR6_PLAFP|nr:hypothetical protein PFUGPA_05987 [Plasmodium falciparum Palo Alto/Uganda]
MDNFNRQTQQRFHEYDERMVEKRMQCKDQCDKEIQKIILKDKLEKELMNKFATLQTDIQSDAIPTCVCEKSLADKVEKACLRCGGVLGGGVTPAWGLLSGIVYTGWKAAALAAAKSSAIAEGAMAGKAAGIQEGIKAVMNVLNLDLGLSIEDVKELGTFIDATSYTNVPMITEDIYIKFRMSSCLPDFAASSRSPILVTDQSFCNLFFEKFVPNGYGLDKVGIKNAIEKKVGTMVLQAKGAAEAKAAEVTSETTAELTAQKTGVFWLW